MWNTFYSLKDIIIWRQGWDIIIKRHIDQLRVSEVEKQLSKRLQIPVTPVIHPIKPVNSFVMSTPVVKKSSKTRLLPTK